MGLRMLVKILKLWCVMRKVKKYIFMGKGKKNHIPKLLLRKQVSNCVKNVLGISDM